MKNFERRNAFYYDERDVGYDDFDEKRERERVCVCGGGGLKVVVVVVVVGRLWRLKVCVYFLVVFSSQHILFSFDDESAFDEGNKERRRRRPR